VLRNPRTGPYSQASGGKKQNRCYQCGNPGHFKPEYPEGRKDIDKGNAIRVPTQEHGERNNLWPIYPNSLTTMVLLSEESRKLTFEGFLIVSTPHQVRTILQQKVGRWLTDSRILKYEAILLERDDLVLTTKNYVSPGPYLIEYQTEIRPDLRATPFLDVLRLFVDGSSRVIQGKRHNGYSVVDGVK
jgi:hypothetical protein